MRGWSGPSTPSKPGMCTGAPSGEPASEPGPTQAVAPLQPTVRTAEPPQGAPGCLASAPLQRGASSPGLRAWQGRPACWRVSGSQASRLGQRGRPGSRLWRLARAATLEAQLRLRWPSPPLMVTGAGNRAFHCILCPVRREMAPARAAAQSANRVRGAPALAGPSQHSGVPLVTVRLAVAQPKHRSLLQAPDQRCLPAAAGGVAALTRSVAAHLPIPALLP